MSDSISTLDDEVDEPDPRELTGADVGTTLDCGCEVTRTNIPCGQIDWDDEAEYAVFGHDYPDTGCGDCRFGVPAVYHDEDTCTLFAAPAGSGGETE